MAISSTTSRSLFSSRSDGLVINFPSAEQFRHRRAAIGELADFVEAARAIESSVPSVIHQNRCGFINAWTSHPFTAPQYDPKGENKIITQYDMYSIEEAGLLKFDFLGLKNLSILYQSIGFAKKIYGETIELEKIPLNDKKTFNILAKSQTVGLFQLNGDGMTRYLKELRPTTIHDINAMVALYCPGPIQFIPVFIECKHDPSKVKYLDPALEPIFEKNLRRSCLSRRPSYHRLRHCWSNTIYSMNK